MNNSKLKRQNYKNMLTLDAYINQIFTIQNIQSFEAFAVELFHLHYKRNTLYQQYCQLIGINAETVQSIASIPFLPITFFKTHTILLDNYAANRVFMSSGTVENTRSRHFVVDEGLYITSSSRGFEHFYGNCENYAIVALLPSYIEQGDSSLVFMVEKLMEMSGHPLNGFYLHNFSDLKTTLSILRKERQKTILIGVSYALLDFGMNISIDFPELIVIETGGMKGRGKEMIRKELHQQIQSVFSVKEVHSEYGMTELMSQAYSKKDGLFNTPPWMCVLIRDMNDPFGFPLIGAAGGINVVDFANIYSCPFIATEDVGVMHTNGMFEVLGRLDDSDTRGCNIMVTDIA